jgi:uncharacterized membrane protein YqjE
MDGHTVPPEAPPHPPEGHASNGADADAGPARALTLHLLRMLETRMDAAGIALNTEVQTFSSRLQLKLAAAGALFIAVWGGIVLLAVALPEPYRVPVLAGVVVVFVILAIWAQLSSKRRLASTQVGSMRWFLDGLKQDLEVLSRSLHHRPEPAPVAPPSDSLQ